MNWGLIGVGAALALAAVGSALGAGSAGMAAVGAWKKCFVQNKPAPFLLVAFVGAPLTQTIYGFILMNALNDARDSMDAALLLGAGVLGGLAIGMSAWFQGKAAA
ncbi:MAG: V-type ATP synthase subunit K, partial [Alkalispirochaetaceae bacterium]